MRVEGVRRAIGSAFGHGQGARTVTRSTPRVTEMAFWIAAAFGSGCAAPTEPEASQSDDPELAVTTAALAVGGTVPEFTTLVGNFDQDAFKEVAVVTRPYGVPTLRLYNVTATGRTALGQELPLPWARGSIRLLAARDVRVEAANAVVIDEIVVAAGGGGLGNPPTLRVYSGGANGTTWTQVASIPAITTERCAAQDCRPSVVRQDQSLILSYRDERVIHVRQYDYTCLTATGLMTPTSHLAFPTACPGNAAARDMPETCDPQLATGFICSGLRQDTALAYSDGRGAQTSFGVHIFKTDAGTDQIPYPHIVQYDKTTYTMATRGFWWRLIGYGTGTRQALSLVRGEQLGVFFDSMTCSNNHVAGAANASTYLNYPYETFKGTASSTTMFSGTQIGFGGQALVTYSDAAGAFGTAGLIAPRVGLGPAAVPSVERQVPFDPLTQFVAAGNFYGNAYDEIAVLPWRDPPVTVALSPLIANGTIQKPLKRDTGSRVFSVTLATSRPVGVAGVSFTAPAAWPPACRVSVYREDLWIPLAGALLAAGVVNRTNFAGAKLGGDWRATIEGCTPPAALAELSLRFEWRNP